MKTLKILAFTALAVFAFGNANAQRYRGDHDGRYHQGYSSQYHGNRDDGRYRGNYGAGYHGGWERNGYHGYRGHGYSRFGLLPYLGLGLFYFGARELSQSNTIYVERGYTYVRRDRYCIDAYNREYICGYEWIQQ